jgi:hypothetical protein
MQKERGYLYLRTEPRINGQYRNCRHMKFAGSLLRKSEAFFFVLGCGPELNLPPLSPPA